MKAFTWALLLVLLLSFLTSLVLSIRFLPGQEVAWNFAVSPISASKSNRPYVAVLLPSSRDVFFRDLLSGIQIAAKDDNIDLETSFYGVAEGGQAINLERLVFSGVAGVLFVPSEELGLAKAIDQAERHLVPVVLLERDVPQSRRQAFVGISSYEEGLEAGKLIRDLHLRAVHAGILLSQADRSRQTVQSSLLVMGMADGLALPLSNVDLDEKISPPGRFAGEEIIWQMFRSDRHLNVLVTTTPKDSLSAVQAVVEANRVKQVNIIAVGEDRPLKEAFKQGVVKGLILRDAVRLGQVGMKTMAEILQGHQVSSYQSLPVRGYHDSESLPR